MYTLYNQSSPYNISFSIFFIMYIFYYVYYTIQYITSRSYINIPIIIKCQTFVKIVSCPFIRSFDSHAFIYIRINMVEGHLRFVFGICIPLTYELYI